VLDADAGAGEAEEETEMETPSITADVAALPAGSVGTLDDGAGMVGATVAAGTEPLFVPVAVPVAVAVTVTVTTTVTTEGFAETETEGVLEGAGVEDGSGAVEVVRATVDDSTPARPLDDESAPFGGCWLLPVLLLPLPPAKKIKNNLTADSVENAMLSGFWAELPLPLSLSLSFPPSLLLSLVMKSAMGGPGKG
jgi:hypothetical protein